MRLRELWYFFVGVADVFCKKCHNSWRAYWCIINFSINKYWTYQSKKPSLSSQLVKFYIVAAGSILLKSNGTVLFTALLHIDYKITRVIVDLIVSIGFNFMLQKYWVLNLLRSITVDHISGNRIGNAKNSFPKREYQDFNRYFDIVESHIL